jgi:hypothetical protein
VTKGGGPDVPSSVLRADLASGELVATELPGSLSGGACLCDGPYVVGDLVVVMDYQHGLLELDPATGAIAKTIKDPAVSPDSVHVAGGRLYGLAADDAGEYAIALFDPDAGSWSIVDQGAITKLATRLTGDADHLVAVLDPAQATGVAVYELGADGKPTGAANVGFKTYAESAGLESYQAEAAVGGDQVWLFLDDGPLRVAADGTTTPAKG